MGRRFCALLYILNKLGSDARYESHPAFDILQWRPWIAREQVTSAATLLPLLAILCYPRRLESTHISRSLSLVVVRSLTFLACFPRALEGRRGRVSASPLGLEEA
jgi:hypothetical protein